MWKEERNITHIFSSKEQQKQGCSMTGDEVGEEGDPGRTVSSPSTAQSPRGSAAQAQPRAAHRTPGPGCLGVNQVQGSFREPRDSRILPA